MIDGEMTESEVIFPVFNAAYFKCSLIKVTVHDLDAKHEQIKSGLVLFFKANPNDYPTPKARVWPNATVS